MGSFTSTMGPGVLRVGDIVTDENIRIVRPGFGLEPKYLELGRGPQGKRNLRKGAPLKWDDILHQ